jgi:hypothetical protein
MLEGPPIGHFSKTIKRAVCSEYSRCNTSARGTVLAVFRSRYTVPDRLNPRLQQNPRVEAAAERALLTGACRYQSVKSILKNSLDVIPTSTPPSLPPSPPHDNIRGAEYFE